MDPGCRMSDRFNVPADHQRSNFGEGRCGDIAANALLQTLANGLFTSATPGTNPIGHSGRADEAAASGSFARALFNNPFSAVQC